MAFEEERVTQGLWKIRGCLIVLLAIAGGCAPSPIIPEGRVDIAMRRGDRLTFLPSTIHGKQGYFAFDTGCSVTALSDVQFRDLPRQRKRVQVDTGSTGGKLLVNEASPPLWDVGPFRLNNLSVVWLADLSSVSEAAGVKIWGCIGADCFSSRIVRIDPDVCRISMLPAGTAATADWGTPSNCRARGTWMLVPVVVGGQTVWCNIDTGDGGSVSLPRAVFDKVLKSGESHDDLVATAAGMADGMTALLPELQLFGRKVPGVSISVTDNSYGSVGMGILSRFVLTIDYPRSHVYARRSRSFDHQDTPERSGIGFVRRNGQVVVAYLESGGAAERAGAHFADVVLSINGRAMDSFEFLDEVPDLLSNTPPAYRLVVQRGNRRVEYGFSPE
jgi:hypothetical protein